MNYIRLVGIFDTIPNNNWSTISILFSALCMLNSLNLPFNADLCSFKRTTGITVHFDLSIYEIDKLTKYIDFGIKIH